MYISGSRAVFSVLIRLWESILLWVVTDLFEHPGEHQPHYWHFQRTPKPGHNGVKSFLKEHSQNYLPVLFM